METSITMLVAITFSLNSAEDRGALETKIDTFKSNQAAGSKRVNQWRDDPSDTNCEFWFKTNLHIVVAAVSEVASIRSTLMTALDAMPTVIDFDLHVREKFAS